MASEPGKDKNNDKNCAAPQCTEKGHILDLQRSECVAIRVI